MHSGLKHHTGWLLPVVLILFLLEIFTSPLVLEFTYAGRSEAPSHVLTYTTGKLTWDSATGIDRDGAAVLSLFDSEYDGTVNAEDGGKVLAPGTDGEHVIRLKNDARERVKYTAVLYEIKDNPQLPVNVWLDGEGFADTEAGLLPAGTAPTRVLRTVTGTVGGGELQDFDIDWSWEFEKNESQDETDTLLGDEAAFEEAAEVTVGFYLVVEDNSDKNENSGNGGGSGSPVIPTTPKTGDAGAGRYLALLLVSGFVLVLLLISRRRERRCVE